MNYDIVYCQFSSAWNLQGPYVSDCGRNWTGYTGELVIRGLLRNIEFNGDELKGSESRGKAAVLAEPCHVLHAVHISSYLTLSASL
jgi:hypothetical protein